MLTTLLATAAVASHKPVEPAPQAHTTRRTRKFRTYTSYATCYNLNGRAADGTAVYEGMVAHNFWAAGTKIRLLGRSFHGRRKFTVHDTGPALADGHFDIWTQAHSCAAWGRRTIKYKIGWGSPFTYRAKRVTLAY